MRALTELSGVEFDDVWKRRLQADFGPLRVDVIGREDFIRNKRATGRLRDAADVESLGASDESPRD